jgi:hypothetical protein
MADRTPRGAAVDERSKILRKRRLEHEIRTLEISIFKLENDILEAELNIERVHEGIVSTKERIQLKKDELAQFEKGD